MKKNIHFLYYVIFIAGLWLLNRQFQDFIAVNGLIRGLLVGFIIAFLVLLVFKTITKIALFIIALVAIAVFLYSIDFLTLPEWFYQILNFVPYFREQLVQIRG